MTIRDFKELIDGMIQDRMGLDTFCQYVSRPTRDDKRLREEYLPILAVVRFKKLADQTKIELGDESSPWDARVGGTELYEVVQALPTDEHEERLQLAEGVDEETRRKHASDHLQFPHAILSAIESKHAKNYADRRTLVVAFDGGYAFEEDAIVLSWMRVLRTQVKLGSFTEILLCDVARRKVFPFLRRHG